MRRHDAKLERLRTVPRLRSLGRRDLRVVARHTYEQRRRAGHLVTRQGHAGLEAFVIVRGTAAVLRDGREIARLGPGDLAGEMAVLDATPRSATVMALTDLELLTMHRDDLRTLMRDVPAFRDVVLGGLTAKLRAADARLGTLDAVPRTTLAPPGLATTG